MTSQSFDFSTIVPSFGDIAPDEGRSLIAPDPLDEPDDPATCPAPAFPVLTRPPLRILPPEIAWLRRAADVHPSGLRVGLILLGLAAKRRQPFDFTRPDFKQVRLCDDTAYKVLTRMEKAGLIIRKSFPGWVKTVTLVIPETSGVDAYPELREITFK